MTKLRQLSKKTIIKKLVEPQTWLTACIGLIAIEAFLRVAPKIHLSRIDYPLLNGTTLLPPGPLARILGGGMFYSGAVAWVTLFRALKPKQPLPLAVQGALFSHIPFLVSSSGTFPLLGIVNPRMRRGSIPKPGLLGLKLNGWNTVATNYLGHLIFGLAIGFCEEKAKLNK